MRAANALATLAAAAAGTAAVYEEQARLAESRRLIAEASEQLASSLDYETTLSNVAALVVPALADWCVVDIVAQDGAIQRLAVAHEDPDKVEQAQAADRDSCRSTRTPTAGPGAVIRTQRAAVDCRRSPTRSSRSASRDRPELLAELREPRPAQQR